MLGVATPLKWKQQGKNLVIETPRLTVDQLPCKYAYAFKVTGVQVALNSLTFHLPFGL